MLGRGQETFLYADDWDSLNRASGMGLLDDRSSQVRANAGVLYYAGVFFTPYTLSFSKGKTRIFGGNPEARKYMQQENGLCVE